MPRKKKLPECIRRHGSGYRAVCGGPDDRVRGPVLPTVDEAVTWRDTYRKALAQPIQRAITLTLTEGLELVLRDLQATGARDDTAKFYRNHSRPLFAALGGGDVGVHTITAAQLRRFIDDRRAAGISPATIVGKDLFVLRRIMKLARADGFILPDDPFATIKMPKGRAGRFGVLTRERLAELVARMRRLQSKYRSAGRDADVVEALFCTGLRRAEFARLRVPDIDLPAHRMFVDGKTGNRYQPFGATLAPVLRRLIAQALPDGRLVPSWRTVEKLFERWQKRLGEPLFSPHVMRSSFATDMAARVGPFELMALMDHSDLKQTSRYYHGRGENMRAALDDLRPGRRSRPRTSTAAAPAPPSLPAASPARPATPRPGRSRRGRRA